MSVSTICDFCGMLKCRCAQLAVRVVVPKQRPNRDACEAPVAIYVGGRLVATVSWVNGPPYYEVHAINKDGVLVKRSR